MPKVLSDLKTVVLKNVVNDFKEDVIGNIKILQGIVRTDAFLNLDIPNDANAREFEQNAKNVREMIDSIRSIPEDFVLKNNGIRIIASEVQKNTDGSYTIFLDDQEGVVNGNHTANVLRTYGRTNAFVPVFIQIGNFSKRKLSQMSTALNSHKKLDERSRQDKLDKHEWIKKLLDKDYNIQYHSGGAGDVSIDEVLRRAYLFYADDKGRFHERAGAYRVSKKGFHNLNEKGRLERTRYILKDIMGIYDWVQTDTTLIRLLNKPNLNKFITKEGVVHPGLVLHIISTLKAYMYVSNSFTIWHKNFREEDAKSALRRNYRKMIDIIKAKKYETTTASNQLGALETFFEFEGLRKTMQIEYMTQKQQQQEEA